MFLMAVPLVLIALAVSLFIKEVPLATRETPEAYPGDSEPSGPPGASVTSPVAGSSPTSV